MVEGRWARRELKIYKQAKNLEQNRWSENCGTGQIQKRLPTMDQEVQD